MNITASGPARSIVAMVEFAAGIDKPVLQS
jgi:hypothetical protein